MFLYTQFCHLNLYIQIILQGHNIYYRAPVIFHNKSCDNSTTTADPPPPHLSKFGDTLDRTPIELHTTSDPVHPGADHHDVSPGERQIVGGRVVRQVEVVSLGRPLRRYRVDLLDVRTDAELVADLPHNQV